MSHITTRKTGGVKDLTVLGIAAQRLGLKLSAKSRFKSYGGAEHKCDYALTVTDNPNAYELGITMDNGVATLHYDDYRSGRGLMDVVGKGCEKLLTEYHACLAEEILHGQGHSTIRNTLPSGALEVIVL